MRIHQLVRSGILGLCIAANSYLNPSYADKPQIEKRVMVNTSGLDSLVIEDSLQQGLYRGRYRADGEFTLNNPGQQIPAPLLLSYSICFPQDKDPLRYDCIDGKTEDLSEGLVRGELRREFGFKMRFGGAEKNQRLVGKRPKVTIKVGPGEKYIYLADHFLPPVQEYECKQWCPAE